MRGKEVEKRVVVAFINDDDMCAISDKHDEKCNKLWIIILKCMI